MNPLPSAPLTAPFPASPPAWAGFPPSSAPSAPSCLNPSVIITREQLAAHLTNAAAWRSLPDGTPLRLQAEGMEYIIDDFGGFNAAELRSAHRLLYFATRTEAQMRALWIPPVPRGDADEQPDGLALHVRALQAEIGAWASATFAPDAFREVRRLAHLLWQNIMERMPVSAEKKNPPPPLTTETPESASPTSATCAGSSPAEMPSATSSSPSAPTSAPSSPPSSVGPTSTDIESSPSPKSPAASPPPAP